jgi:large subunit ribosomal protein L14e
MLVDGPCTGVRRQVINLKCLYLTKFVVRIPHSARESTVRKAWLKAEIDKKWAESSWAKKLAAAKLRANCTDLDRFKLMRAKQQVLFRDLNCFLIIITFLILFILFLEK